jgi:dihydroorotase
MSLILKNGFVVDPENNHYGIKEILIKEGKIVKIAEKIGESADLSYDLTGKTVFPGFIDMHVHLREPGFEGKETLETGLAACAAGGFTGVAPMPNTNPVTDSKVIIEYIKAKAEKIGLTRIYPVGAITKGEKGEELANVGEMVECGAVGITDDGKPVSSAMLAKRAFEYIKKFDIPLMAHSEDHELAGDGVMNFGEVSLRLGLKGIPNAAEDVMVARDIVLCEQTGSRLHVQHCSTKDSLRMIKEAKSRGVKVTVEVTPHHFTVCDEEVEKQNYSTSTKMNPPLRSAADLEAVLGFIKDGTVDMIATDHAPHSQMDKEVEFDNAPFGITGIETAIGLTVTNLLSKGIIDLNRMAELMSINARKVFKIEGGIKEGIGADITVVDLDAEWVVDKEKFYSKGKNTPFNGWKLKGKPYMTIVDGKVIMAEGKVVR